VFVLCALTIAALVPPAFYVWGMASSATANWQYNHAQHVAAARIAMLMIVFPGGGAALGGLAAWLVRPVPTAGRAAAMAAGAFAASLVLTIGGLMRLLGHAQYPY
jgi:hypothetical protein